MFVIYVGHRFVPILVLSLGRKVSSDPKLQALDYDILPSTTAVFSYAIGSRKLLPNEQFFVLFSCFFGAQTVVSLSQTTEIISDVCFVTDHLFLK